MTFLFLSLSPSLSLCSAGCGSIPRLLLAFALAFLWFALHRELLTEKPQAGAHMTAKGVRLIFGNE